LVHLPAHIASNNNYMLVNILWSYYIAFDWGFFVFAAIFALYTCYFLKLNMFTTLRYLGIIGIPTFLFGQKLLSLIAARR